MTLYETVDVVLAATSHHPHGGPVMLVVPVLVIAAIVYFVVRRRRRSGAPSEPRSSSDPREGELRATDAPPAVPMASQVPDRPRVERPAPDAGSTFTGRSAISLSGLTKSYGARNAVDGLTFSVRPGTVCGFVGPNGAGKTTTIRMLLGLITPTAGTASVLGHPISEPASYLARVGALIEGPAFTRRSPHARTSRSWPASGASERARWIDASTRSTSPTGPTTYSSPSRSA
jgi:ABC-type multidrug transport system fused ATPase/permease subunit